jgi:hypothetical protein
MNPLIPKVVCGICKIPMVLDTSGINVAEVSDGHPPRIIYKTSADKFVCPSCGFSVLTGYSRMHFTAADVLDFDKFLVAINTFSENHSITFTEIESILSELRMLVYGLEMKRDNLKAYVDERLRNKIRRRKRK